jgi:hypothetical protein
VVPSLNGAHVSAELARSRAEDHDRIAQGLNDVVVRRIFAAGLDLHAALAQIGDHRGAGKIYHAIGELDHAIREIRDTISTAAHAMDDFFVMTADQGSPCVPPLVRAVPGGLRKSHQGRAPECGAGTRCAIAVGCRGDGRPAGRSRPCPVPAASLGMRRVTGPSGLPGLARA